ncbi:MAG: Cyclic nucleotide-binding domain protein [Firmicutes bacterium]|nr:Cyclic nucleotide-binding domain protein [Bacillota bacterium]
MESLELKEKYVKEEARISIAEAKSEAERQAIYRFRYQVLVNEMGRNIPGYIDKSKRVSDRLDSWSHLFYAESQGQIIGTARVNVGGANDFPQEFYNIFQLGRFEQFCSQSNYLLGSKVIVAPKYRRTALFFRLMGKCYEVVRNYHVQFSFGGCNPYLLPIYEQFGYRYFFPGFQDPGFGFIVPILLVGEDIEFYNVVRSPFLRIARKHPNSPAARAWLTENFSEALKYPAGLLTSESERWEYIAAVVGDPLANLPVLESFNEAEARCLLRVGSLIECRSGQQLIRWGDVCNELYILLAGEMVVDDRYKRTWRAKQGDTVGEMGLFGQTHHQVNVTAITDCKLLVISRFPFEKARRSMPEMAAKILVARMFRRDDEDE